jgi:chemotaxis protein MotB
MATDEGRARIVIKRKRGAHGAHHGGAWKVAYADFVTAMMALFMVLWLLTQADMKLRAQIAQYFRNPGVLSGGAAVNPDANAAKSREPKVVTQDVIIVQGDAEQERLEAQKEAIDTALAKAAEDSPELARLRDQVIVQVTDAGLSIQVVDKGRDLLFDLASAEVKPALLQLLKQLARQLGQLPNAVEVGGHTDSRPFAPESGMSNWELAFARANNARKVLETNGLRLGQIHRIISYADSEPLVPDNPLADENRRLSILAERQAPPPPRPDPEPGAEAPTRLPPDPLPATTSSGSGRRERGRRLARHGRRVV